MGIDTGMKCVSIYRKNELCGTGRFVGQGGSLVNDCDGRMKQPVLAW